MTVPPGFERIGRYEIIERLGRGGMGVLYRGRDTLLDRQVAIKVMNADLMEDETARRRFFREARAAARLQHRNIITVFEFAEEGPISYIVMEFLRGQSLETRIRKGPPLALDERVDIVAQLVTGLHFAHEQGVVHRDVKPGNIWLQTDGSVKLLDFGIAKLVSVKSTDGWQAAGSVAYLSPEQLSGIEADERSDIFSAGVVLYELLCGRRPFEAETPTAVMQKVLHEEPAPLGLRRGGAEAALSAVVRRALEKDPQKRYQTASAMASDLGAVHEALVAAGETRAAAAARASGAQVQPTVILSTKGSGATGPVRVPDAQASPTVQLSQPQVTAPAAGAPWPQAWGAESRQPRAGSGEPRAETQAAPSQPPASGAFDLRLHPAGSDPAEPDLDEFRIAGGPGRHGTASGEGRTVSPGWWSRAALGAGGVLALALISLLLFARGEWLIDARKAFGRLTGGRVEQSASQGGPLQPGREADGGRGPAAGTERLQVTSQPPGASLALDGLDLKLQTPASLALSASSGVHRLRLTLAGYQPLELDVSASMAKSGVTARLEPALPTITFLASGAYAFEIVEDGSILSPSAPRHTLSLTGRHVLRLRARQYLLDTAVTIDPQGPARVERRVPDLATLLVTLDTALGNCRVLLGARDLGYEPFSPVLLAPGNHALTLACPQAARRTVPVTVAAGEQKRVSLR